MKNKVLKIGFLALSVFSLFGCNKPQPTPEPEPEPEPEPQPEQDNRVITLNSPVDNSSMYIADASILAYMDAKDSKTELSVLKEYQLSDAGASSISLSWNSNGSSFYEVQISSDEDFSNFDTYKVSGIMNSLELYNLIPGKKYKWRVKGTSENDGSLINTFTVLDSGIRPISASGAFNIRDIGGWATNSDKTIKYGQVYRGGMLNGYNSIATLDEDGIDTFNNQLKIKTEIDLRSSTDDGGQNKNYFDQNKPYIKAPLGQYTAILSKDDWNKLPANEKSGYLETTKDSIKTIFETLADSSNYPIYFHCNAGADRTGTLSYLINGLLGVEYSSLVKDFEITSFSTKAGIRYRSALNENGDDFDTSGVYQNDSSNFVAFDAMNNNILRIYGSDGGTLSSAIENYLISYIGLNPTSIINIKKNLLNGYTTDDVIIKDRQTILLSDASSLKIDLSTVSYDSINNISCDGVSLGKNPNALIIPENFDSFGNKQFVIQATKGSKNIVIYLDMLIVTKEISTWDELLDAVQFGGNSAGGNPNKSGYFRLSEDIVAPEDSSFGSHQSLVPEWQETTGAKGFNGVLDGNGYSVTSKSGEFGLFSMTAYGAEIKNIKFIDTSYVGTQFKCIVAIVMIGTTFDNVTFECLSATAVPMTNAIGWLSVGTCKDCTFKDCTFNGENQSLTSMFGGYAGWMGYKNNTFESCHSTFANISNFGYENGTSTLVGLENITGIDGTVSGTCSLSNTIETKKSEAALKLDNKYANCEILSVTANGHEISGDDCEIYNKTLYFPIKGIYGKYDEGMKDIYALIKYPNGFTTNLRIPTNIISPVPKVYIDSNDIVLTDKNTFALNLGEYSSIVPGSITLGNYSLGTDPAILNFTEELKNDLSILGDQTINVIGKYNSEDIAIKVSVTIVTKLVSSNEELYDAIGKGKVGPDGTTPNKFTGYYKLTTDLTDLAFTDYVSGKKVYSYEGINFGFQGTLDGDGHTLTGACNNSCYGLFCLLGQGSCIKDLNLVNTGFTDTAGISSFAYSMNGTTIEDVTITFLNATSACSTIQNNHGWINAAGCKNSTFKNVTINANGLNIGSLFGGWDMWEAFDIETNKFENFVINAKSIGEIGHYGAPGGSGSKSYQVSDIDGITFVEK